MSEFRTALQALYQSLNGCEVKPFVDGYLKKFNDAASAAQALLARPEPKTYLHLEGYELANAYECLGGDLETDVTISSFAEAKDQETGEEMPAGMYLGFTDYPEEGRIFLSPTEAPALAEPVARPEPGTDQIQPVDDEPEPRITREEAEKLLTEFAACVAKDATGPSMDNERRLKEAFEACLAAMLRPEPAPSVRPDPQTKTLYVFLQQRPRDKQPFPLVYVDQQLAEAAPHRVTPVVAVDVPMLPSPPAASDGEKA